MKIQKIKDLFIAGILFLLYFPERREILIERSLSHDESIVFHSINLNFFEMLDEVFITDTQGFLYYTFLKIYNFVIPQMNDYLLRLPSVLFGFVFVFLLYTFLKRILNSFSASVAFLFILFHEPLFEITVSAKAYSLFFLLLVIHSVYIYEIFFSPDREKEIPVKKIQYFALTTVLLSFTHPLSIFYFAPTFFSLIVLRKDLSIFIKEKISRIILFIGGFVYIPYIILKLVDIPQTMDSHLHVVQEVSFSGKANDAILSTLGPISKCWDYLLHRYDLLFFGDSLPIYILSIVLIIVSIVIFKKGKSEFVNNEVFEFFKFNLLWYFSGLLSFFIISIGSDVQMFESKYLIVLLLPIVLSIAIMADIGKKCFPTLIKKTNGNAILVIALLALRAGFSYKVSAHATAEIKASPKSFFRELSKQKIIKDDSSMTCIFDDDQRYTASFYSHMYFKKQICTSYETSAVDVSSSLILAKFPGSIDSYKPKANDSVLFQGHGYSLWEISKASDLGN